MVDYSNLRKKYGHRVCQTLDSPIMIFDIWEVSEIFAALISILIFGVLTFMPVLLLVLLGITLAALPYIRTHFEKGALFHYPYRAWGISLPGLFNPKGRSHVSD